MKRWIVPIAAALAVLASGGWYIGSPAWTLRQMKVAADERNAEKLSSYIDYPELRETTKAQVKGQMMATARPSKSNGFEAIGMMLGMAIVDPMVDTMLTPDMMRSAFAKEKAEASSAGPTERKGFDVDASHGEIVRDDFDHFRLHDPSKPDSVDLVFERHGLGWKLAKLQLPKDLFADKAH